MILRVRTVEVASLLLYASLAFAQQQPPGLRPRSNAADYAAHVTVGGVTYAASLLSSSEVKHTFAFDISKNYAVFEVALFPDNGSNITVDPDAFLVRSSQAGDPVRPTDSITVASVIQQKNLPPPETQSSTIVHGSAEVGYESERDPVSGQKVHGTYTASQVGVGSADPAPPRLPGPGGYPQDRELLESQLWAKSLPSGRVVNPTSGYLYFPISLLKKKSGGTYELEYTSGGNEPVLNGSAASSAAVRLSIPAKSR